MDQNHAVSDRQCWNQQLDALGPMQSGIVMSSEMRGDEEVVKLKHVSDLTSFERSTDNLLTFHAVYTTQ